MPNTSKAVGLIAFFVLSGVCFYGCSFFRWMADVGEYRQKQTRLVPDPSTGGYRVEGEGNIKSGDKFIPDGQGGFRVE